MVAKINLYKDDAIMHKCIKKISKVLALTTMVSSFAFSSGPKAMVNEPADIPPEGMVRQRVPARIADEVDKLNEFLDGNVIFAGGFFNDFDMAYKILKTLNESFRREPEEFREGYIAYLNRLHTKLLLASLDEAPRRTIQDLREEAGIRPDQHCVLTGRDLAMFFDCDNENAKVQTIGAFAQLVQYFCARNHGRPIEPWGISK